VALGSLIFPFNAPGAEVTQSPADRNKPADVGLIRSRLPVMLNLLSTARVRIQGRGIHPESEPFLLPARLPS
jgi:hypothetical protein